MNHLLLPGDVPDPDSLLPEHESYLRTWLTTSLEGVENGDTAASICLQGAFIELAVFGELRTDWLGVFDTYLTDAEGRPVAYSEKFGERLYKFMAQTMQPTIHAAHSRWWIEQAASETTEHDRYADLIEAKVVDGWIYDHDVSPTIERHRMRSELTMSLAQSLEILIAAGRLGDEMKQATVATLSSFPQTGYASAEYFRLRSLELLESTQHMPVDTGETVTACSLPVGFCDFAVGSKIDAYMGTAKRTARDKPVHSPLAASQVQHLLAAVTDEAVTTKTRASVEAYTEHMRANPLDIPAFQMRDIAIPFGADKTPIEVLCAASLIHQHGGKP